MTPGLPREDGTFQDLERKVFCKDSTGEYGKRVCLDADSPGAISDALSSTTPNILNISVPLANTEVSQSLTDGTKQVLIRCRGNSRIQFSFVSGNSGTIYLSIPPGNTFYIKDLKLDSKVLYLQCNKAAQVIEILEWT